MSKYRNRKIECNGEKYDSVKEYQRHRELKLLEAAGKISGLRRQVRFELVPTQREPDTIGKRGGVRPGKVLEASVCYYADYVYQKDGTTVVEDVKGVRTQAYIIKRKLMLYVHGIRIQEV